MKDDKLIDQALAAMEPTEFERNGRTGIFGFDGQPDYAKFSASGGSGYTKDGFFHFFGGQGPVEHDLYAWNEPSVWQTFFDLRPGWLAIAEDAFGHQFCMRPDGRRPVVKVLSPWTGDFSLIANSFEDFLRDFLLGTESWSSLHEQYQAIISRPSMRHRQFCQLTPLVPPILGGDGDDPTQFEWLGSSVNMSMLGQLFAQLKNVEPGTLINKLEIDKVSGRVTMQLEPPLQ
jgi:hypothetical protein